MSESRAKKQTGRFDSPYQRIGILVLAIVISIGLIFVINFVVKGLGGNEKKLMEAVVTTLKEPRINGDVSLAQQAQTNTFDFKGTFSLQDLKKFALDGKLSGVYQNEQLEIPAKAYMDFDKNQTYLRISNAQKVASTIGASAPTIQSDLTSIATKIDDKWLLTQQGENKTNTCTADLFAKVAHDTSAASQLAGAFAGNRFLVVEGVEAKSDTKQEYTVKYDEQAMAGFTRSLKTKEFFKSTKSCDQNYDPLGAEASDSSSSAASQQANTSTSQPTATTKMTVDNGKITSIVMVSSLNNQVNTTRISLNFKKGDTLTTPTQDVVDSSSIQQELASLGKVFQQQQQQQQTSSGSSAIRQ